MGFEGVQSSTYNGQGSRVGRESVGGREQRGSK